MKTKESKRTCKQGHTYFKSSDCPVCPICESEKKPESGFLSLLAAPARRAMESEHISTLQELSRYSENYLLSLHGFGKSSIPKLKMELEKVGLQLKKED